MTTNNLTSLQTFINQTVNDLIHDHYEFYKLSNEASNAAIIANNKRNYFLYRINLLKNLVKDNPNILDSLSKDEQVKASHMLSNISKYEQSINNDPLEILLNWCSTGSNESFILSQIYDLIGKDDARTFKILLRNVINKYSPTDAAGIW